MNLYLAHVMSNPFLLMSPCAEKFSCPNKEVSKNHCAAGCKSLNLYRQMLDVYGKYSIGGLSYGHVYQSASSGIAAEESYAIPNTSGGKRPTLDYIDN